MSSIIQFAREFAVEAHEGQLRRYTLADYVVHSYAVAKRIEQIDGTDANVCIALLHDVLEDTNCTYDDLWTNFGGEIADGVRWLTDTKTSDNRSVRKTKQRMRLSQAPGNIQNIKVADVENNLKDIVQFDATFAPIWLSEVHALLSVLDRADSSFRFEVLNVVELHLLIVKEK